MSSRFRLIFLVLSCLLLPLSGCSCSKPRVVLYCAQDREFAEGLLADFTKSAGLEAVPKFDTEADKSVSLYVELVKEKDRPRCDVFWNNEVLSTIRLQKQGLLLPHASASAKGLPEWAKASDNTWHAFATRARILIVNTDLVAERDRPKSLLDLTDARWKGKVVMAQPQFGTSATQAGCLFDALGEEKAKRFYRNLKANGVHIAPGNKQVAEWVAAGKTPGRHVAAIGITDTDDAIEEVTDGRRVAIIFPDQGPGQPGTLFIPNTLALIKGGPNPEGGRKLIDFLLSAETEQKLAEGSSHQFPLHENVEAKLPAALEPGRKARRMKVDFAKAAALWDDVQTFLRNEFAAP
jgi:iron(III) transport system substrate-binding protein